MGACRGISDECRARRGLGPFRPAPHAATAGPGRSVRVLARMRSSARSARMDLQGLDLFIEVARQGSFAAAARSRGLDPSSVSRTIAGLEAQLGARLFQRTSRAMMLTEAGELYLARLPGVIDELTRLRDEAASLRADPVGVLRMTASVAFGERCLTPLLSAFQGELSAAQARTRAHRQQPRPCRGAH